MTVLQRIDCTYDANVVFADFARRHLLRLAILKATDRWDRALLIACAGDPEHERNCPYCARIAERIRAGFRRCQRPNPFEET